MGDRDISVGDPMPTLGNPPYQQKRIIASVTPSSIAESRYDVIHRHTNPLKKCIEPVTTQSIPLQTQRYPAGSASGET